MMEFKLWTQKTQHKLFAPIAFVQTQPTSADIVVDKDEDEIVMIYGDLDSEIKQ